MTNEWTHRFTDTRNITDADKPAILEVEAGLHLLSGNARPYFSVTGSMYRPKRRHDPFMCGCLHDDILKHWPTLAPIVALHLSDDTGTPMHAIANSWYQLAGYYGGPGEAYHAGNGKSQHWKPGGEFDGYRESTPDECLKSFAEYVRISIEEARRIADTWKAEAPSLNAVKAMHAQWCKGQAERWQQEANAGIALLDALIAAKG